MHYTECVVNMQKALPKQPHTHIPDAIRKHQKEVTLPKIKSLRHKKSAINPEKYSSVFRKNRCPPPPKPVYGGNFSHEAVTLKIGSRSPKSNKLLILSDLYKLANLVTFHPMVHEITCRQTPFGLILVD